MYYLLIFSGPYVFIEEREKINITWDHTRGTISYHQKKNYYFAPELTNGSLDDLVYHVNVPLVVSSIIPSYPTTSHFLSG